MKLFTRRKRPTLLDTAMIYTAGGTLPDAFPRSGRCKCSPNPVFEPGPIEVTFGPLTFTPDPDVACFLIDPVAWDDVETDPHWSDLFEEVQHAVTYKPGYRLLLRPDSADAPGRWYYQVESDRTDAVTGEPGTGKGGKAYLSPHATRSELAQTAFGLFKAYEEHEAREWFRYDGRQVYGPHFDVLALHSIAHMTDVRQ